MPTVGITLSELSKWKSSNTVVVKDNEYLLKYPCKDSNCSPYNVTLNHGIYKIELVGASGGYDGTSLGAKGAYTSGILKLDQKTIFFIYIGEAGKANGTQTYNGGGKGSYYVDGVAGSGGGATDMRIKYGKWDNTQSLRSRIMVAGGGSGDGNWHERIPGGCGGLNGLDGSIHSTTNSGQISIPIGGTQKSGGKGSKTDSQVQYGTDGQFGIGGNPEYTRYGSGGGGGYYGGGAGTAIDNRVTSGGGGSSFISGHNGCDAINENGIHTGKPIHYSKIIFENSNIMRCIDGNDFGITDGYGFVKVTVLSELFMKSCEIYQFPYQSLILSVTHTLR